MPVRSFKKIKPVVWIPPLYTANPKITLEHNDGTVDDVTDIIIYFDVEDGVTDGIGKFKLTLMNHDERYTGVLTGNEIVRYYKDYATTATTLRFRGRIEKPSFKNNQVVCTGRSEGKKFSNVAVTKTYDNIETSAILKDLVDSYGQGNFTYTNVNTSTTNKTTSWYQVPFWDAVRELANDAGFDVYIDSDLDFNYFETGTRTNTTDAIVHEQNMFEVGDFANDLSLVKNRVVINGAQNQGIQTLYTAESTDPSYGIDSDLGVQEEIVNDDSISTYVQAQQIGDALLALRQDPPVVGDVKGTLLATIQPGQKIKLSSPENNIPPTTYQSIKYKDVIDVKQGKQTTTVTVQREVQRIPDILKSIIGSQNKQRATAFNPEEMRFGYNFLFESSSGTHDDTQITNGVLKLASGKSSGTWTSASRSLSTNINAAYLTMNGQFLTTVTVQVSGDNGITWQTITNMNKIDVTTATGTSLKVRVVLADSNTEITSLSLLYKVE